MHIDKFNPIKYFKPFTDFHHPSEWEGTSNIWLIEFFRDGGAIELMANHYRSKYDFHITFMPLTNADLETASLEEYLKEAQERAKHKTEHREVLYIKFKIRRCYSNGHAVPLIYIKSNDKEGLFIANSLGNYNDKECKWIFDKAKEKKIAVYSITKQREMSDMGCYEDAFVFCREAAGKVAGEYIIPNLLQFLEDHSQLRVTGDGEYKVILKLPPRLLKTFQSSTLINDYLREEDKSIIVNKEGQTIEQYDEKYKKDSKLGRPLSSYVAQKTMKLRSVVEIEFYINQLATLCKNTFTSEHRKNYIEGAKKLVKPLAPPSNDCNKALYEYTCKFATETLKISLTKTIDIINQSKHIVVMKKDEPRRWHDNPDISDLMLAMFGLQSSTILHSSLCLHMYDKISEKGLNKFYLTPDNTWKATELVKDLGNRILYHPILTVSTTNAALIKKMFSNILDGIDGVNGHNGIPAVIIIPMLMHKNHFGTLAIKPANNSAKAEIYYFNSLGTLQGYEDEENLIFDFMKKRYNIKEGDGLIYNNKQRWQTDGCQCAPYAIWFVGVIAKLVSTNNLNKASVSSVLSNIWHMGIDTVEGKAQALKVRGEQANLLEGLNTNFSIPMYIDFKLAAKRITKWYEIWTELSFPNLKLLEPCSQKNAERRFLMLKNTEIRDSAGIDAFGLQKETQEIMLKTFDELNYGETPEDRIRKKYTKPFRDSEQNTPKKPSDFYNSFFKTTFTCALGGTLIGALMALIFRTSPNISPLRALSSCFAPPQTVTFAAISNAIIGGFVGLVSGIVINYTTTERVTRKD